MRTGWCVFVVAAAGLVLSACGSVATKTDGTGGGSPDASVGTGGSTGGGGATGSGGSTGSGGAGLGGVTGSGGTTGAGASDGGPVDAATDVGDAPSAACDLSKPFGAPALVSSINDGFQEIDIWLTPDSKTTLIASNRGADGGSGNDDIYIASRTSPTGDFGVATALANINSTSNDRRPVLSSDGLTLFFTSNRVVGDGGTGNNIFVATRTNALSDFGAPGTLAGANTSSSDLVNSITSDGKTLYFDSGAGTSRDIYMRDLTSANPSVAVTELNSTYDEGLATISADSLTMYFGSTRPLPGAAADAAATTDFNIWIAHRTTPTGTFTGLAPVPELNTTGLEVPNWISPDGCTIYISTDRSAPSGSRHIWSASKPAL